MFTSAMRKRSQRQTNGQTPSRRRQGVRHMTNNKQQNTNNKQITNKQILQVFEACSSAAAAFDFTCQTSRRLVERRGQLPTSPSYHWRPSLIHIHIHVHSHIHVHALGLQTSLRVLMAVPSQMSLA